jgi:hypothetical protein
MDNRFDWLLIQPSKQLAYKLTGINSNDTFIWSQKIAVTFYISANQVTFRKDVNVNLVGTTATTNEVSPVSQPSIKPTINKSQSLPKVPRPISNLEAPPTPPI